MEEAEKWRRNQSGRYRIQLRLLPMALTPGRTAFKVPPLANFDLCNALNANSVLEGETTRSGHSFDSPPRFRAAADPVQGM